MEVNFKENKKEICKEGIMHCGKKSSDLWIYVEEEDLWFIWEAKCPNLSRIYGLVLSPLTVLLWALFFS